MLSYITRLALAFFLPLVAIAHFPPHPHPPSQSRFDTLVFIADSYTDTANVYKLSKRTWPLSPPYYRGRFCNGPNYVDQLRFVKVKNYAYGGATTDNALVQGYAKLGQLAVPGLRQQVQTYLSDLKGKKINGKSTLHCLWGAGNDFVFNASLATRPDLVVDSLLNSASDLIANGAENILIFNLLPSEYIPRAVATFPVALLAQLTAAFNSILNTKTKILQLNNPHVSIEIFNVSSLLKKVVTTPLSSFDNTTASCWNVITPTNIQRNCADPNKFVFLDDIHLSSTVHSLIADPLQKYLSPFHAVNTASFYVYKP